MPLVKRTIEPVEISRNRVITGIKNELDFVTNSTLGNVIQQLSSLSKHVEDVFSELHHESCSLFNRTCQLNERIDRLKIKITQLNPTVEEVLLQDINMRKPFKSSVIKDQQIITITSRPYAVEEVYKRCEPPPALQKLNPYRHDGKDSLKFYTEPGYFFELWCQAMQKDAKYQMKRHKRVRRPQKMTAEPPKVPTNPCQENRKLLPDSDHLIDASYRYGCVQYLDNQIHSGAVDLRENRELIANDCQRGEHIRNDACNHVVQEVIANSDSHLEEYVTDATPVAANGEPMRPAAEANENEKDEVDNLDAVADLKLVRPSSLELPMPVNGSASLEKTNSQLPIVNDLNISEEPKKVESSLHSKYSACQSTAGTQVGAVASQKVAGEQMERARTAIPLSLTMCKATVEIPTNNKELSLLVEVVSSKHMSGAKVSSSSILGTLPSVPPPIASASSSTAEGQPPDGSQVADAHGKSLPDQISPKENIEQNMVGHIPNESYFLGHSVSVENNRDPPDENAWGDSLPAELNTKSSTPDSVDLPPPPSPPPFSHAPDSPSLISLPPLPPPPLEEADEVRFGFSGVQPLHPVQVDKAIDSSSSLLPNGNVRHLPSSMQNSVSTGTPQIDTISTISDSSLVTISSGSTSRSEGAATVALELPLVRDTRCDLLAAIREGIKLRKVEERRQKTEQKHLPTRRLDVQTIMEAAFEMRRKVLEENDSEEEEDEFDSNWSDDD